MNAPFTNSLHGKKVIVALSGGVDSAVAACLLQRQGAIVEALHMTNWEDDDGYCTAAADLQDARRVCEQLNIPLHHVNFSQQYRDRVFAYFLQEYKAGRTPNPDVLCNREIKFGVLWSYAKRLGADKLATGHYARIRQTESGPQLLKGLDQNKDQSYFLHAVNEEPLRDTLFPLGEMRKDEVRALAREQGFAVFAKKDSTGICFIGERPFREFLQTYIPAQPGPIETPEGEIIGEHAGLMFYTIGQRQGLGIGGMANASDAPWYVADKRLQDNTLIVVQGEHPLLYSDRILTGIPSWIGRQPDDLAAGKEWACSVKVRYRQPDQACIVKPADAGKLEVIFDKSQRAVAPGQYAVFYAAERCLGGAVIEKILHRPNALGKAI